MRMRPPLLLAVALLGGWAHQDAGSAAGPTADEMDEAHRAQMQSIHHQGHSRHEFRAIQNMDEMHRMGGIEAMPPLEELKPKASAKMGINEAPAEGRAPAPPASAEKKSP